MITLQNLIGTLQPPGSTPIRTLLIDNYDSYTYNLYQLIAQVNGAPPAVVYNDEIDAIALLKQLHQGLYHNIVISPGPGTPTTASDIGLCLALIKAAPPIPILGVCLGFQALALAYGASILRASEPVHGRLSAIRHSGFHPLFSGIPSGQSYQVVRYHSLIVDESTLPEELEAIAWTAPGGHHALGLDAERAGDGKCDFSSSCNISKSLSDEVLMAIAHKSLPYYGVQYHPESVGTAYGHELLRNFKEITLGFFRDRQPEHHPVVSNGESIVNSIHDTVAATTTVTVTDTFTDDIRVRGTKLDRKVPLSQQQHPSLRVYFKEVPGVLNQHNPHLTAQSIFDTIFIQKNTASISGTADSAESFVLLQDTFWLDTAAVDRGRFSFMGSRGGALWRRIGYRLLNTSSNTSLRTQSGAQVTNDTSISTSPTAATIGGVLTSIDKDGNIDTTVESSFWDWLNAELQRWTVSATVASNEVGNQKEESSVLPFDFCGGLIGYLGYELKADGGGGKAVHASTTPDASFFLVDQFVALDHKTGSVYAVAVHSEGKGDAETSEKIKTERWVETIAGQLEQLKAQFAAENNVSEVEPHQNGKSTTSAEMTAPSPAPLFQLREPKAHYIKNIESCMEALYAGDSYELCLTTEMRRPSIWGASEAWTLYKILRKVNPAPYAAWLQFGGTGDESSPISICCSSPERFLKGDKTGGLEAKTN
ncbi:hypothetical protein Ndes2437B_g07630 [Nannochloris sp. 'desiccata']